ncbi:MAG: hypothetical protein M3Q33_07100 [Acidobacteriota bacterium]|nr:hypothetical protein [Acidobacteriota bacterium]
MNRFRNLIAVFAFSLLILGLPAIASAQWRNDRNDDDNYRNGGYNGGYNNRALQSTVRDLKNRSKQFARQFDRELDRSRYDGSDREDRLNDIAKNFAKAADDLEDEFDGGRDLNRSYDEARRVLDLGSQLERAFNRARLSSNLSGSWNQIRQDLRVVANAYNYNNNNNRNRNNRRGNNDWWRNLPF